ncbi:TlpA disulfide reductase family protein [Shewanella gelidii]|uniref:Alkyl hydroperoxide reductase n=1 Tax=Shewanella gelidii TaxID=1642821 RepID=A0A917JZH6_9GAMM|nr:TlpA disulfide reductase family protein [Shewanella gelidii]MCL1099661.1 TlpA family protein disulfide reductase [Shewanella gelidii]GGI92809.1 alkyl hydroperoxide reductase [Shewanella gelidii]
MKINSLVSGMLMGLLCLSSAAYAYPGAQNKQQAQGDSRVRFVSILPQSYPIEAIPFKDTKGNETSFGDFKGKIVMVNMWATWCPPCVRELPALERLADKFSAEEFVVLPISIDRDGKDKVEPFLKSVGLESFSTFYDKDLELGAVFPLDTIPATFILNQQGELIAYVRTFVDWDDKEAEALISAFLSKD